MKKHKGSHMHDESRRLPPDAKGRKRYMDKRGDVLVWVGVDHPIASGLPYVREHRLLAWESGVDVRGKFVSKDGKVHDTYRELLRHLRQPKQHYCRCGCGQITGKYPKYLPGHRKSKNHLFQHLNLSRERKRQLRRISEGKCIRNCDNPVFRSGFCEKHWVEKLGKRIKNPQGHSKIKCYLRGEVWRPKRVAMAEEAARKRWLRKPEPEYYI